MIQIYRSIQDIGRNVEMRLTARRLNRATLARQLLLRREPLGAVEAVRRVVALQAQSAASPYVALWNRLDGFDPVELDVAFADHVIVKATLMRITLHAVGAGDYPAFHRAMLPTLRAARLLDSRFTSTGLTTADADGLVPHLVEFAAQPRDKAQVLALLSERLGKEAEPRVWWALRTFAPLVHAPTGGPWSFGLVPSYLAAPNHTVPPGHTVRPGHTVPPDNDVLPDSTEPPDHDEAVSRLARRYLEAFGPATAADLAQFSLLTRARAREALRALGGELRRFEGPDGAELFDVPEAPLPAEDTPAPPRLMAMWDSVLLAYADRSRVIPPDYRKLVIRNNGDVLPTLLVDGHVAGVWLPVEGGIEATAFHQFTDDTWQHLEAEARALVEFLADRDPAVYRRYARWWKRLPSAQTRILAG